MKTAWHFCLWGVAVLLFGCSNSETSSMASSSETDSSDDIETVSSNSSLPSCSREDMSSSSERSSSSEWYSSSSVIDSSVFKPRITYSTDSVVVEDNNGCVEVVNSVVTISCGGTYEFTGANEDGQIVVNTLAEDSTVHVRLNNLTLKNSTDSPFFVINASKTIIKNLEGSVNTFEDASTRFPISYQKKGKDKVKIDTTGACVYAKDDLTINGKGSLYVYANYKNGIQSANDLRIRDYPTIEVYAPNNALKGKGSVDIEGGLISLNATDGAGIKSDEGLDEQSVVIGKGSVRIKGGEITIRSGDDGIDAYNEIIVSDEVSLPVIDVQTKAKGLKASKIKMGNAHSTVYSGSDGWKVRDTLLVSNGFHYMNVSSDGIDVENHFSFTGGVIIIENFGVEDSAFVVALDNPIDLQGEAVLLGFGKVTSGGFAHDVAFSSKKYYGTETGAFKPSFNGSIIVVEQDDANVDERDVSGWESVCFPKESTNCYFYK